jgi:hypothetical protein
MIFRIAASTKVGKRKPYVGKIMLTEEYQAMQIYTPLKIRIYDTEVKYEKNGFISIDDKYKANEGDIIELGNVYSYCISGDNDISCSYFDQDYSNYRGYYSNIYGNDDDIDEVDEDDEFERCLYIVKNGELEKLGYSENTDLLHKVEKYLRGESIEINEISTKIKKFTLCFENKSNLAPTLFEVDVVADNVAILRDIGSINHTELKNCFSDELIEFVIKKLKEKGNNYDMRLIFVGTDNIAYAEYVNRFVYFTFLN